VDGVEGDVVYGVDAGAVVLGGISVALEGEVGAVGLIDLLAINVYAGAM
jgi:hypothetical protein